MKPVIDRQNCMVEPEMCMAMPACPNQALYYHEDVNESAGGRIAVNEALCDGCGICATECCGDAIYMHDETADC